MYVELCMPFPHIGPHYDNSVWGPPRSLRGYSRIHWACGETPAISQVDHCYSGQLVKTANHAATSLHYDVTAGIAVSGSICSAFPCRCGETRCRLNHDVLSPRRENMGEKTWGIPPMWGGPPHFHHGIHHAKHGVDYALKMPLRPQVII